LVYIWEKRGHYPKSRFWKEHTFRSNGYFVESIGNANEKKLFKNMLEFKKMNAQCRLTEIIEDGCLFLALDL